MPKSYHLSRNDFVKFTVGALGSIMGAIVGIPAVGYLIAPALKTQKVDAWIALGPLENYPIGVPTPFTFTRTKINGWEKTVNSFGVFVVRKSESEVIVLSNVCTHLNCRVTWNEEQQQYICPCHDGRFTIEGEEANSVVPEPLYRYTETKIEDGSLSIRLLEG